VPAAQSSANQPTTGTALTANSARRATVVFTTRWPDELDAWATSSHVQPKTFTALAITSASVVNDTMD